MKVVREILIYNLIGWMEILQCIGIMYGIFQSKIKESKRIYIRTIRLIEILLLAAIGMFLLFPSQKVIWSEFLLVGFLVACFLFQGRWLKVIFVYSLSYITQYYLEALILLVVDILFGQAISRMIEDKVIFFVFSTVIVLGISLLIRRSSYLPKMIEDIPGLYFGVFIVNGIGCCMILYNVLKRYENDNINGWDIMTVFGTIVVCFIFILIGFILVFIGESRKHYQEENRLKEEYIEMQKEYYNTTYQADQSMRKICYDITANLGELNGLIKERKFEETIQYLGHINGKIDKVKGNKFRSNRPMVDALLNRLAKEAEKEKVKLKLIGGFGETLFIQDYHLCSILYNSVESAIQACRKVKNESQRVIAVEIGRFKNSLDLKITNSRHENVIIQESKLGISEEDIKNHGYAIGNVKDAVDKYDGIIEFYSQGKFFLVEIVFLEAYQ